MREVELPSGAKLRLAPAPFADAKALYQALLVELKGVPMAGSVAVQESLKMAFCLGYSSPVVEQNFWKCASRCLYNDEKITLDTFEPVERRGDYMKVVGQVIKENVDPFVKSLYADYATVLAMMPDTPA